MGLETTTLWVWGAALGLGIFGLAVMLWIDHQAKKH